MRRVLVNRAKRAAVGLLTVTMAASACGGVSQGGATTPQDTLTIATGFAINSLDPVENGFWAPEFGYGDLLMKPLRGGEIEPWLLKSLTKTSEKVWTLRLRPNITFHNGHRLDAAALAELMTYHLRETPNAKSLLPHATVEAEGARTVVLTARKPIPNMPSLLADESVFAIFDLPVYRAHKDDPDELVGAGIHVGPYTVTALTPRAMKLRRASHYYGSTPTMSRVTVRFVKDPEARVKAVRNGEADLALYPPTSAARRLKNRQDAYFLTSPPGTGTGGLQLFLNQRSGSLTDVRVRRALQLGIDYRQLSEKVMNGLYDTAVGLYPASRSFTEKLLTTDPKRAAALLDEAGWTRTGDAVRTKDGQSLTLELLTYPEQPDVGVVAVAVQAQLREVGVEVKVHQVDDINAALEKKKGWNLGISSNSTLGMTGTDPIASLVKYYASDGVRNYGGIHDARLDDLIDELTVTGDTTKRATLLGKVQQIIVADKAYGWFLSIKRTPVVVSPALRDYPVPEANLWLSPYA